MPRCAQAAAVRDAQGMLPLELALRHKAPAAVVEALKQAHVSISALLKTGASDAEVLEAVQGHSEAAREVEPGGAMALHYAMGRGEEVALAVLEAHPEVVAVCVCACVCVRVRDPGYDLTPCSWYQA